MSGSGRKRAKSHDPPRVDHPEFTRMRTVSVSLSPSRWVAIFRGITLSVADERKTRVCVARPRANTEWAKRNASNGGRATVSPSRTRDRRGARGAARLVHGPIVIILQLGHLPVTYFSSPSLLQSEWAVGQVRSSHVKTPVASSLVEPTTSELRVTLKMAVVVVIAAAAAAVAVVSWLSWCC